MFFGNNNPLFYLLLLVLAYVAHPANKSQGISCELLITIMNAILKTINVNIYLFRLQQHIMHYYLSYAITDIFLTPSSQIQEQHKIRYERVFFITYHVLHISNINACVQLVYIFLLFSLTETAGPFKVTITIRFQALQLYKLFIAFAAERPDVSSCCQRAFYIFWKCCTTVF